MTTENFLEALKETEFVKETIRHIWGLTDNIKELITFRGETERALDEHRIRLEALERGKGQNKQPIVDTKKPTPDPFTGNPKDLSWRDWSYRLKVFMGTRSPALRAAMVSIEHRTTPVESGELETLGVPHEDDTNLGRSWLSGPRTGHM